VTAAASVQAASVPSGAPAMVISVSVGFDFSASFVRYVS